MYRKNLSWSVTLIFFLIQTFHELYSWIFTIYRKFLLAPYTGNWYKWAFEDILLFSSYSGSLYGEVRESSLIPITTFLLFFFITGAILRPGFIHGTRRVGSVRLPLSIIGAPLEMVMHKIYSPLTHSSDSVSYIFYILLERTDMQVIHG